MPRCCGFGGSFCVKYPAISEKMVDDKIRSDRKRLARHTLLAARSGLAP